MRLIYLIHFSAMKILALAVLMAVVQAPLPVPRKATDNPAGTAADIQSKGENNQANSAPSPSTLKASGNGPAKTDGGEQHPNDAEHTVGISKLPPVTLNPAKRDAADWGYWVFNLLLVVVGVLQVILLHQTMKIVQRQTDIMGRQLEKERPHIRVDVGILKLRPIEGSDEIAIQEVNYTVRYYGFANAFISEDDFSAELTDSPTGVTPIFKTFPVHRIPIITPGTPPDDRTEHVVTTQFEIDSLNHRKSFIQFTGRIRYRYFSDAESETTVCRLWESHGTKNGKLILPGRGRWKKIGPPEANHET